ncbi:MAG: M28 family peptidase [Bacteroidota bacterium]
MKTTAFTLCLFLASNLFAQVDRVPAIENNREVYAATITTEDLRRHLSILSSDEMEGRETGEPGQVMAAAYLASVLESMGYPAIGEDGGYYQSIAFRRQRWEKMELSVNGEELRYGWDFYSNPFENKAIAEADIDELIFLGYGIDSENYSDFEGQKLAGKDILIFGGEPKDRNGNYLSTGTSEPGPWSEDVSLKLKAAKARGVRAVFVVDPNFRDNLAEVRRKVINGRGMTMVDANAEKEPIANSVFISTDLARNLLGKNFKKVVKARKKIVKKGKPYSADIPVDISLTQMPDMRGLDGVNVLGYLEGSDPELKEELLIVSAHYDHIGRRGDVIFNGADDNGSGTSTVLEMAEAFMMAKKNGQGPRRSIAFMLVSGEEKGLLGSKYYVENPIFPLEQTIADINIDMVGRVDEKHADNPYYIYVIGSDRLSTDLHRINEEANDRFTQLELDYTYNAEDDPNRYYYRSDHYNFAERGIPAIFFFNGTHEDYHGANDTVDKINFDKMAKIAQLAFHLAWDLSNRDERIKVDVRQ